MIRRLTAVFLIILATAAAAETPEPLPDLATHTQEMRHHPGLLDLYWDADAGRVLMAIEDLDRPLIRVTALVAGAGSNDIGLDRGQLGSTRLVHFRHIGRRVLMIEPNLDYRAETDNPDEARAVGEAFAQSVLASLPVVASTAETVLVDLTDHLLSDVHGVVRRLADSEQGSFSVDAARSAPWPDGLRSFPANVVVEAMVTFTSGEPGPEIASVTPDPGAVSLRLQHQFVALPEDGFERRAFHPRSGFFPFHYRDYAVPLGEPIDRRVLVRHRLELDDQGQVVDPLVYYVDRGAPEPIRSALMEGAGWWAQAFDAAGLAGGYRVELLPEGVDPLDVRYNVIQWVHRSTRGWSYGSSVRDPRSGEILKGHISLGSLRVRQDMLIAEGLLAPFETGEEAAPEVQAMALARLRQLSAHEVGHTLGLAHNFAASAESDASVMDYPHPFVRLDDEGRIRLEQAYDSGIGEWDKLAIEYGYRVFADDASRDQGLREILERAKTQGLSFISDPDARGFASPHAAAHLWDNGADPLERFDELMAIRERALDRFGIANLRTGEPLSELEQKLVPIYLLHRYQAEAVAKLIGGLDYAHGIRGDADQGVDAVPAARQWQAVNALVDALAPSRLALRPELLALLQPPAYGFGRNRESFTHATAAGFDAWAPARAAAQVVAQLLLEPGRLARLDQQHAADAERPSVEALLETLIERRVAEPMEQRAPDGLQESVAWVIVRELQRLTVEPTASDRVRASARQALESLSGQLGRRGRGGVMAEVIDDFLVEPRAESLPPRETVPPGSPI